MSHYDATDLLQLVLNLNTMDKAVQDIAETSSKEIEQLVIQEFSSSSDPYGNAWEPNQKGTQTLVNTGAMLGSLIVVAENNGITLEMDNPSTLHQTGTSRMPKRMIFPEGTLPDEWTAILDNNTKEVLDKKFGGK